MSRAVTLAYRGAGWVSPNPMVGAVLVADGMVIGEGFHEFYGGPHAEVNAIRNAEEAFPSLVRGATMYVTLEPCSHHGKTPPCSDLLIEKGIGRVVVGMNDPNPVVNGSGTGKLRDHGVDVMLMPMNRHILRLNEIFIKYISTGLPFVTLKTAMTLDGKIATVTNASRWITGEKSRKLVHRMRQQLRSVMVGVETILADDPLLNIRLPGEWRQPLKVVADTRLRIPESANVLKNDPQLAIIATTELADRTKIKAMERMGAQVIVCPVKNNMVDLGYLTKSLGTMGIDSILLEGGSTMAFSALQAGIVDKVVSFIAPKILGGSEAPTPVGGSGVVNMDQAICLSDFDVRKIGRDLMIESYVLPKSN